MHYINARLILYVAYYQCTHLNGDFLAFSAKIYQSVVICWTICKVKTVRNVQCYSDLYPTFTCKPVYSPAHVSPCKLEKSPLFKCLGWLSNMCEWFLFYFLHSLTLVLRLHQQEMMTDIYRKASCFLALPLTQLRFSSKQTGLAFLLALHLFKQLTFCLDIISSLNMHHFLPYNIWGIWNGVLAQHSIGNNLSSVQLIGGAKGMNV